MATECHNVYCPSGKIHLGNFSENAPCQLLRGINRETDMIIESSWRNLCPHWRAGYLRGVGLFGKWGESLEIMGTTTLMQLPLQFTLRN